MVKRNSRPEVGGKVLVVDDEREICRLCYDTLKGAGYEVETTTNPHTALNKVSGGDFTVVLTDIKMPQINGLELIDRIKAMSPDLPVVIMTGYATLETAVQAVKQGASNFVRKPFNLDELNFAVAQAIERQRLLTENIRLTTLVNFFKVSEEISSLHDPSRITTLLLKAALKETRAERGAIFEVDPETEQFYLRQGVNLNGCIAEEQPFDRNSGLPGRVFRRKSPQLVADWQADYNGAVSIGEETWSRAAVGVPLKTNEDVGAVLCLYKSTAPFTEADLDGAVILATQASTALRNADLMLELEILFLETMKSLAMTLDARDPYTHGHSRRVAQIAVAIGEVLALSEDELENLELAGVLHDIGKIGIRDAILHKAGKLTPEEYEIIKSHPRKGYEILRHIRRLSPVVQAVYCHHEWHNGGGYPRGLKGEEIPMAGAIIAVADAFDTMVTERLYQKKRTYEEALQVLKDNAGTQFNPEVVQALCQVPRTNLPLDGSA